MIEFRITSGDKKTDNMIKFLGADHYFIYNPLADALRKWADFLEKDFLKGKDDAL